MILPLFLMMAIWPFSTYPQCTDKGVSCVTFSHPMSSLRIHTPTAAVVVYRAGKKVPIDKWWMERSGNTLSIVVRVDKVDTTAEEFRVVYR